MTTIDDTGYEPGKGDPCDHVPAWMNVPRLYSTERQDDPPAVIKLFTPDSSWTWFILEYDGDDTLFGLVVGSETELGYFSLSEIQSVKGPMGLEIERDLWFEPTPITGVPEYRARWGKFGGPYKGSPGAASEEPAFQAGERVWWETADGVLTGVVSYDAHDGDVVVDCDEHLAVAGGIPIGRIVRVPAGRLHKGDLPDVPAQDEASPPKPVPLPDGWTIEDIEFLLEKLDEGCRILVADRQLGIPTIHDWTDIRHCGFGVMMAERPEYTVTFDAGASMQRTPSGKGWTGVNVRKGEYPHDLDGVRATLQSYLVTGAHSDGGDAETVSESRKRTHTLTFGDNGAQVYFEGEMYLVLNPYLERDGRRYGSGWAWYFRSEIETDGEWRCLPDPDVELSCIGNSSLEEAIVYAERVEGVEFELVGAPDDLPDSYPVHEMWRDDRRAWRYVPLDGRRLAKTCLGDVAALTEALEKASTSDRINHILSTLSDLGAPIPDGYVTAQEAGAPEERPEFEPGSRMAAGRLLVFYDGHPEVRPSPASEERGWARLTYYAPKGMQCLGCGRLSERHGLPEMFWRAYADSVHGGWLNTTWACPACWGAAKLPDPPPPILPEPEPIEAPKPPEPRLEPGSPEAVARLQAFYEGHGEIHRQPGSRGWRRQMVGHFAPHQWCVGCGQHIHTDDLQRITEPAFEYHHTEETDTPRSAACWSCWHAAGLPDLSETRHELGAFYRDWLSVTNGDESAHPSAETMVEYQRWAEELVVGGEREREGGDFRRFCRVRLEGKNRGLDLMAVGEAYGNEQDFPAPEGWACLQEEAQAAEQPRRKRKLPDDVPDAIEVDLGHFKGWATATAEQVRGRWLHYRLPDGQMGKVQVVGRDIVWRERTFSM